MGCSTREENIDEYTEMLKTRMIDEIGKEIEDMRFVVIAGGGATL